jgi:hypothetical protein
VIPAGLSKFEFLVAVSKPFSRAVLSIGELPSERPLLNGRKMWRSVYSLFCNNL